MGLNSDKTSEVFFVLIDVIMKTFIRHRQKTKKEVKNDDRMRKRKIP